MSSVIDEAKARHAPETDFDVAPTPRRREPMLHRRPDLLVPGIAVVSISLIVVLAIGLYHPPAPLAIPQAAPTGAPPTTGREAPVAAPALALTTPEPAGSQLATTLTAYWAPGGEAIMVLRPDPVTALARMSSAPELVQIAMPDGGAVWVLASDVGLSPEALAQLQDLAPPPPARAAPFAPQAPAPAQEVEAVPAAPAFNPCKAPTLAGARRCAP